MSETRTWTHSDITDAAGELDNTGGPGGDSVRALLKDYDLAAAEVETVRAVAQGNKRHVALLTQAYEELEARALASDARQRLARHLWLKDGRSLSGWDGDENNPALFDYYRWADEALAVITGKAEQS